jgi:hypothetical protein
MSRRLILFNAVCAAELQRGSVSRETKYPRLAAGAVSEATPRRNRLTQTLVPRELTGVAGSESRYWLPPPQGVA